jgi:DnaK suppressor protein
MENQRNNVEKDPNKSTEVKNEKPKRYSDSDLKEFKELILAKLETSKRDCELLKEALTLKDDNGTNDTSPVFKLAEDGVDTTSKEEVAHQAIRLQKYIVHLQNALIRIENKTYGICSVTGELIAKERLRSVPHSTLSINAKLGLGG